MQLQKTPIALATFALFATMPLAAQAITVSFKEPQVNETLSNVNYLRSNQCEVTGTDIRRVAFSIVSSSGQTTALNTETGAPWNCTLNSKSFADGNYTLRAVAYDASNRTATATRAVTIKNNTSTGGTANPAPVVSFVKPANNANVAVGSAVSCQVNATDANGIATVQWFLDGNLVNTEKVAPYDTCNIYNITAGTHKIKAVATDTKGAQTAAEITVTAGSTTTPPPPTTGGPVVTITKPANGSTITTGPVACAATATDPDGIQQVQWYLGTTLLNTELNSPYDACRLDATSLPNGTHELKAVATDKKGAKTETKITLTKGTTGGGGGGTNTPPSITLNAPSAGATVSGTAAPYAASATDSNGSVAKVDFFLIPAGMQTAALSAAATSTPTPIATKTAAPYSGTFDSTQHTDGSYTMRAVATDNLGATAQTDTPVTIANGSNPNPNPGTGTGTTLPSTNAKAIVTFESIGMYWTPTSTPSAQGCTVRYRKFSESAWKEGLNMWYDARNNECRGSIVHVEPGTDYAVEMGLPGQAPVAGVNTKTWSDNFPIAKTIQVTSGTAQLNITEGGSPSGYVVYTGPATLDGQNTALHNIKVSVPYVIIRGLTLKGAKSHAILLAPGTHDVVVEDNDISGWGLPDANGMITAEGWKVGKDGESAVKAYCTSTWLLERTIIQRNKIHHPRYGSNSWSEGHPRGPNGAHFNECGGNHVFRYNEIYSETGRYFMDGFGGAENFGTKGMPNADSDIYGNIIMHSWDDGIEAEGANRNVRVWGNYIDSTAIGVASTSVSVGPIYIWRNVWNRARTYSNRALDSDGRNYMLKSGDNSTYGKGRRYVFHNTMLQATQAGVTYPLGGGSGLAGPNSTSPLSNTISRNNVFQIWKTWWSAFDTKGGAGNDLDYDMTNGSLTGSTYPGAQSHGITGTPVYAPGHGWQSESGGNYQLAPTSPGYDQGARLPNFNDAFTGAGPDMGAHEAGTPPMRLGIGGAGSVAGTSGSPTSSSVGGTTTASSSGDGLCSTITCAAQ